MGRWTAVVFGGVVAASLACGGNQFARTVLNADVQEGADAALPADFPLTPPVGGTLSAVMRADLLGTDTTTAVFTFAPGADAESSLAALAAEMEGKGLTVERADGTVTGHQGADSWVCSVSAASGAPTLTVIVARTSAR